MSRLHTQLIYFMTHKIIVLSIILVLKNDCCSFPLQIITVDGKEVVIFVLADVILFY